MILQEKSDHGKEIAEKVLQDNITKLKEERVRKRAFELVSIRRRSHTSMAKKGKWF